jgi:hypothetical protein
MCGRADDPTQHDGPTGLECYRIVATELDVPKTMRQEALDALDQQIVERARSYAKRAHQKWPPRPREDGWRVTITSW